MVFFFLFFTVLDWSYTQRAAANRHENWEQESDGGQQISTNHNKQ